MAKSKLSGGYCGNAVETDYESEGSGVSGAGNTLLGGPSVPTKSNSLKSSCGETFGVPVQVVPLSNLLPFQRKDLVNRLTSELEQTRMVQKKIELQRANSVALLSSSSRDIVSCSNGHNGPRVESSRKPLIPSSSTGNKLKPLGQSQKPRGWNQGSTGKFESVKRTSSQSAVNALLMKDCESLLKRLMSQNNAWIFNTPVDVVKWNLPDYFSIIKHPMDLGTVKGKIAAGEYSSPMEFAGDVRLTFSNAMTYNPPGNRVHFLADTLSKYFELRWKTIEKKMPRSDALQLPMSNTCEDERTTRSMHPSNKRKVVSLPPQPAVKPPAKRVMSDQEKLNLGQELESLLGEVPVHIIDFLKENCSNSKDCGEDEIEIDIDDLGDDTLFTLRKLLDDYLQEKQNSIAKVEACEIQVLNDSGPSNSSLQAYNGPADEEVDIGGNESPVSSYPSVEIEKDTTCRINKSLSPGISGLKPR